MNKLFDNLKNMDKKKRTKTITWFCLTLFFIIGIIGVICWLSIGYQNIQDFVYDNFSPEVGKYANIEYAHGKDVILGAKIPTYGEMYEEMGQGGFAWFYLTNYKPIYLAPYILLPIICVLSLIAAGITAYNIRVLFPYHNKKSKTKKKKGAK